MQTSTVDIICITLAWQTKNYIQFLLQFNADFIVMPQIIW